MKETWPDSQEERLKTFFQELKILIAGEIQKPMKTDWLLLLYQIPSKSDSERVRLWRVMQKLGVVAVKNSVAAVPNTDFYRNSIIKIADEICSIGGEAIVTESQFLFGLKNNTLENSFNDRMNLEMKKLAKEVKSAVKQMPLKMDQSQLMSWSHKMTKYNGLFKEYSIRSISQVDGEEICRRQIDIFERKLKYAAKILRMPKKNIHKFKSGSTWVTRKDLYIDRMASAWLIRRYIDPKAKFLFVDMDKYKHQAGQLRFDVFGGEFTHMDDLCTFEFLVQSFKIKSQPIKALAEIIHDLDIEDEKYDRPETAGIKMTLDGLVRAYESDCDRLEMAMNLFDSLVLTLR